MEALKLLLLVDLAHNTTIPAADIVRPLSYKYQCECSLLVFVRLPRHRLVIKVLDI